MIDDRRATSPSFPRIVVPQPVERLLDRARADDGLHQRAEDHDASARWCSPKRDSRELAEELFRAYLHQVILDGLFHADPHPGNVLLTDDKRIALLDLGMVSRLSPDRQEELLQFLLAVADGRTEQRGGSRAADGRAARGLRRDRVPPARGRGARAQPRRAHRRRAGRAADARGRARRGRRRRPAAERADAARQDAAEPRRGRPDARARLRRRRPRSAATPKS